MKRCTAFAVLVGILTATNALQAQQTYTVKIKERGDGEAALVKKKAVTKTNIKVVDGTGTTVADQNELKTEIAEFTETILKRQPGKRPTKLTRHYTKEQSGKNDQIEDGPLTGKTVLIEKIDGKYTFSYSKDGVKLEGAAAAILSKDFSKKSDTPHELDKLVFPAGPVKVGDSWKIAMPKIAEQFAKEGALALDAAKSKGTGTLVKAYKSKDGRQFGEMRIKMEMPLVTVGAGTQQLKFAAGAKIDMDMTFDVCIDGSSESGTMKMKMHMTGNASNPAAAGVTVTLDVTLDGTQFQQEPARK